MSDFFELCYLRMFFVLFVEQWWAFLVSSANFHLQPNHGPPTQDPRTWTQPQNGKECTRHIYINWIETRLAAAFVSFIATTTFINWIETTIITANDIAVLLMDKVILVRVGTDIRPFSISGRISRHFQYPSDTGYWNFSTGYQILK